ncbi:MAG: hypothetical protein E5Y79_28395 [Mesorhizobium sp.]|uniref:superinfection exclusion B family protein n=1 Tax=Mesorhizobium sp. TaxID=1871066 RepID=UPI0011FAA7FA|nr:superinfection exclusion B family protein [Mesorhizobium sp.]TIL56727.1 MAG: hypothetical protein E5Y79_28395 [Mesorhizobium sp.]
MPDWLSSLFSLTKEISSKVALPILIATSALLFLPDTYSQTLGLDQFRDAYRIWIGVIFLISGAALITNLLWALGRFIRPTLLAWRYIRAKRANLRGLTDSEKAILRVFIDEGKASIVADMNDGDINLLEHKKIIVRSSNMSVRYTAFPYVLQPWAREYLLKHRALLED